ncbi:hypothetical protein GH714_023503 [Hevea brasiliensis]|uniref:Uncharacterized protein n=1 Tax=Hevea brasiliensis TaxID=3981 RepID=A0A6A6N357_HEVBR|nr:hypothetical protein GH714_023503 [Hevea brasiliensis]
MDPVIAATLAGAVIGAAPAAAALLYSIGKDSSTPILRKGSSIKNLDHNCEVLDKELQKLIAVATDIDQGRVKKGEIKNTSTYKLWITRVWEIQAEVEALIHEYERIKEKFRREINIVAKGRLSKKMVNKFEEVTQHLEEGKLRDRMIKRVGLELIDRGIVLNSRTKVEMKTFNTGEATKDSRQERVISSKFVEEWQAAEELGNVRDGYQLRRQG